MVVCSYVTRKYNNTSVQAICKKALKSDPYIKFNQTVKSMSTKILRTCAISFMGITSLYAAPGETEGITLVLPFGARQNAMGETGTALADDESCLFYNPAGLARSNARFKSGSFSYTYEALLPRFKVDNVFSMHVAGVYQPNKETLGGFGLNANVLHMPKNDSIRGPSFEAVIGMSHSFNLKRWDINRHNFGYSIKYLQSRFDSFIDTTYRIRNIDTQTTSGTAVIETTIDTIAEQTRRSFAFDIGYIFDISSHFHVGLNIANMGPAILLSSTDDSKPLPFTLNFAFAYTDYFNCINSRTLTLHSEIRLNREVAKTYKDKKPDPFYRALSTDFKDKTIRENLEEIIVHLGAEVILDEIAAARIGYLHDETGVRREFHWGIGAKFLKHVGIDLYGIVSPETENNSGARMNQWGLTLSSYRILNWIRNE
jgi:hypothetical protein